MLSVCDRSHPPFYPTNNREGNITPLNDCKPETETTKLVENSSPAEREPVLTDTSSESLFDSKSSYSCGNNVPCSGSSKLGEQGLLNSDSVKGACASDADKACKPADKSSEGSPGGIKTESGEGPDTTDAPAPATVCTEILKSGSCEIIDSSQLLSSDSLAGDVISEEPTDQLLTVSQDKPHEKENTIEFMLSAEENCATNEPESSHFNGSQNVADAIHQMSNVKLEGESSTGVEEPVHQHNGAVSDAYVNQCSAEVIKSHSVSSRDELENNGRAFDDDIATDEVTCTDVNSDPSFFEELSGGNDHLLEEEDQLPETSDSSPSSQQVTLNEGYYYYDPYRWTPEEIKAATGKDECTFMEHSLKLRSVYTDVEVSTSFFLLFCLHFQHFIFNH